jgi:sarcosine oxidase subunit beta
MFTAWELLRAGGVDVVVLEASHPGDGSSGRSVGMVETQYVARPDVEVRAYGREIYTRLIDEHGLSFVHGGYLRLGHDDADAAAFEESLKVQHDFGIADAELLSPDEVRRRWPHLVTDDLSVALHGSWDGYADGYEVCQLLSALVRAAGARVVARATVVGASEVSGAWRVETTQGVFTADHVVNAAGPWGSRVADIFGAPVELLPELHGAVTIELERAQPFTPFVMDYVPGDHGHGVYFRSERADQLIAGLHTERAAGTVVGPDRPLGPVDDEFLEQLVTGLSERIRDVGEMSVSRSWTGIYPLTRDGRPVVGRHPDARGVVSALGGGGNGIQLGPAIGRLAAEAVLDLQPAFSGNVTWSHR